MTEPSEFHPAFKLNKYLFRRKVFKLFGGAFHVYDENGNVVFYSEQKAFRLREDFSIFSDETKSMELLRIKTPQILDFGATYYVRDSVTGEELGALKRKGFKSIFKDEWIILNQNQVEIGKITEESTLGAFLSRWINLVPQNYHVLYTDGTVEARIRQHFNPWILKYDLTIETPNPQIDRRLLIVAGIMLAAIERRQGG